MRVFKLALLVVILATLALIVPVAPAKAKTYKMTSAAGHPPIFLWVTLTRDYFIPEVDKRLAEGGTIAPWFASVTFGGPDLRTVYIGSLRGTRIPYFRSQVAGLPMVHWKL